MGWPHSLDLKPSEAHKFYAVYLAEVLPAALVVLVSTDLVRIAVGAMVFNVVVLALPLAFLVRLTSDRELLGDLANSRRHTVLLWALTAGLLVCGAIGTVGFFS
jgi:Mn2+/Fe2+ NRAMP family transporter